MIRARCLAFALLAACGGGNDEGEPIGGTISITVADETITPTVGAAIPESIEVDPDGLRAVVVVGTSGISCETTVTGQLLRGTYLTFRIDRQTGMQTSFVSVIRVVDNGAHLNGASGEVEIVELADRVTGSVSFTTQDDEAGAIAASGTFDVIRCF